MNTTNTSNSNTSSSLPIGLRNNNPLNLVKSNNAWLGKISSDNRFEKFSSLEYGIRAGLINLRTYYDKYKLTSISQIISKWAPTSENDTNAYIATVVYTMGIPSGAKLNRDKDTFAALFSAMSAVELGSKFGIKKSEILSVIEKFKLF